MRNAVIFNSCGRGECDVQIGLIYLAVSLFFSFGNIVIAPIRTGNSVIHLDLHGVTRVGGNVCTRYLVELHVITRYQFRCAQGNSCVICKAIIGLFGNGSRYGHGLACNVGRKLNDGVGQVIVVRIRTDEGYGRGIPNGLVRADVLISKREFEAGLIEANIRTFYHAVKLSVGAVNLGIGFAVAAFFIVGAIWNKVTKKQFPKV